MFQISHIEQYLRWCEPEAYPLDMYEMQKAEYVLENVLFRLARAHIFT